MPDDVSLEQRVAALERQVAALRRDAEATPQPNWIEKVKGSFEDDPVFAEIVRLGREWREAQQVPEDFQP